MATIENILIGIGLSMDAFMIAFSKGISWKIKHLIILSISFGLFQCIMTILGYHFGNLFNYIPYYHQKIISFILLIYIGIKMIIEKTNTIKSYSLISILPFSIITSLDAFSVGLALSYKKINTILFSIRIGIITLVLSLVGCMIGRYIKTIKQIEVNKMGGIILILYALKILLDR